MWSRACKLGTAKHIDIRKHFAHEVIQNGHMKLISVATSQQLADIFFDQAAALPAMAGVHCGNLGQDDRYYHLRDLCPQEGVLSPRTKVIKLSHVGPLEGCVTDWRSQGQS